MAQDKKAPRELGLHAMWNPLENQVGSAITALGFSLRGELAHNGQRQIPSHQLGIQHLATKQPRRAYIKEFSEYLKSVKNEFITYEYL